MTDETDYERIAREVEKIIRQRETERLLMANQLQVQQQTSSPGRGTDFVVIGMAFLLFLTLFGGFFLYYNARSEIQGLQQDNQMLRTQTSELANRYNSEVQSMTEKLSQLEQQSAQYLSKIAQLENELAASGNTNQSLKDAIEVYKEKNSALQDEISDLKKKTTTTTTNAVEYPYPYTYPYSYTYPYYPNYYGYNTNLVLQAVPNSPGPGQVTFTATLSYAGYPVYNRQLYFYQDGLYVGYAYTDASGIAYLTINGVAIGNHSAYAKFGGCGPCNYSAVVSNTVSYIVT